VFDPLDWVHAITTQIPDPRQHMVRYQGAYANRVRRLYRAQERTEVGEQRGAGEEPRRASEPEADDVPEWVTQRRRSWARLLRRIYEVDPLVCPRCGDRRRGHGRMQCTWCSGLWGLPEGVARPRARSERLGPGLPTSSLTRDASPGNCRGRDGGQWKSPRNQHQQGR